MGSTNVQQFRQSSMVICIFFEKIYASFSIIARTNTKTGTQTTKRQDICRKDRYYDTADTVSVSPDNRPNFWKSDLYPS